MNNPSDSWDKREPQNHMQESRLNFIRKFLQQSQNVEVELRQDALNESPSAVIQIERHGKGFIFNLSRPGTLEDGSRFFVSRLGKVIDTQTGKALSSSPIDEFVGPTSQMEAWLSEASIKLQNPEKAESDFPFNVFAADGVEIESKGMKYLLIAEREVDGDDTALNFSINRKQDGDLVEVRRVFISRSVFEEDERAEVQEKLSQVLEKLSSSETFEDGLVELDRMVDAGYLVGSIDHELSLETQFGEDLSAKVEYVPEQPIDDFSFFTERNRIFKA